MSHQFQQNTSISEFVFFNRKGIDELKNERSGRS